MLTSPQITDFVHIFERGRSDRAPLLLLHGTGGDERSLLEFGRAAAPGFALISPRGKVLENGQARFFRRFAEGVLDENDLRLRARELAAFVESICAQHDLAPPIAVAFSNGANIATAMMFLAPETLSGAALLRPMIPFHRMPKATLDGKSILIVSGENDQLSSEETMTQLAASYRENGAMVHHRRLPVGHHLVEADIAEVSAWIAAMKEG